MYHKVTVKWTMEIYLFTKLDLNLHLGKRYWPIHLMFLLGNYSQSALGEKHTGIEEKEYVQDLHKGDLLQGLCRSLCRSP